MKPEVKKLVFTELEMEDDNYVLSFIADSPIGAYYIDFYENDHTYSSYCASDEIGEDKTLIKAIQRVNDFHRNNVLECLI